MEVIVKTQDGTKYKEFQFPLDVRYARQGDKSGFLLCMDSESIGIFKEKRHAIHIMNYLIIQRNYFMYDKEEKDFGCVVLNIPSDDLVRQTRDEDLLDSVPSGKRDEAEETE